MIDAQGGPLADCLYAARAQRKVYRQVLKKDPCAYCGYQENNDERRKLSKGTVDHIIPKSKMEKVHRPPKEHEERGWENWTGCCFNCNHLKASEDLLTFLLRSNRPKGKKWPTNQF